MIISEFPIKRFEAGIHACAPHSRGYLNLGLGESPYGMPAGARQALLKAAAENQPYPDSSCSDFVKQVATMWGVSDDEVFIGNGIDEIILSVALAFLRPADRAIVTSSTFSGFEAAVRLAHAEPLESPLEKYRVSLKSICALLGSSPQICFLCNPHNPTGTILNGSKLQRLIKIAQDNGVIVIVDEAYAEYTSSPSFQSATALLRKFPNLVVMRTMSKIYGLAGLRCGYALGNRALISKLKNIKFTLPFNVNRLALAAASQAIQDKSFVDYCRLRTDQVKKYLYSQLDLLALTYIKSSTNFVFVDLGCPAEPLYEMLKDEHHIIVRTCAAFGFPNHIRVTLATLEQMEIFVRSLSSVVNKLIFQQEVANG